MKHGDRVMTPEWAARDMIDYFQPCGRVLEPFRGDGVFTKIHAHFRWMWCEIDDGRDFFDCTERVDWIVSNPPYSKLRPVWMHASTLADNIVFLIPLRNYFSGYGFVKAAREYGDLVHVRLYGTGGNLGFPMGNAVGAMHWKRGHRGGTTWSDASKPKQGSLLDAAGKPCGMSAGPSEADPSAARTDGGDSK